MPDRHDWNSWEHYLAIHEHHISNYLDHFILDNQLCYTLTPFAVRWEGVLYCADGMEIQVTKLQDVRMHSGRYQVRTIEYRYHVIRRVGDRTINLFRYDNSHTQPGHTTSHHRHRYDSEGIEIEPPMHTGEKGWPVLSEVIEEACQVWRDTFQGNCP